MKELIKMIDGIEIPDDNIKKKCIEVWDNMGKPIGSLGQMESLYAQIASIQGIINPSLKKRALVVMCADNGVVTEGVTQTSSDVTAIVAENFFDYKTATSIMCKKYNTHMEIIDVGMVVDTDRTKSYKCSYGTNNFTKERAIPVENVISTIKSGITIVKNLKKEGYKLILTGEMGIGNTTTSSAITACILNLEPALVTGKGAGLSGEGLLKKVDAINRGIKLHFGDYKDVKSGVVDDVIEILSCVGGYDICGMVGLYIGAAIYSLPIIIDGFISAVAALCAYKICDKTLFYMIPSHKSAEAASEAIFKELGLKPIIHGDMRLGEGSGAVMLLPFLDMAQDLFDNMGTFDDIGVKQYEKYE